MGEDWTLVTVQNDDGIIRLISVDSDCYCDTSGNSSHMCAHCWVGECVSGATLAEDVEDFLAENETKQLIGKYIDTSSDGPEGWDYDGYVEFKENPNDNRG